MNRQTTSIYEFGSFRLDAAEHLLLRDGEAVPLTPKAFHLLLVLVERHGHLLEKEELLQLVWPDAVVEEANLASNIALIRKALNDGENGQKFIETMPKRGYRFVAEVRETPLASESTVLDGKPVLPMSNARSASPVTLTSRGGWRDAWMVAGVAVLAALAFSLAYFWRPTLAPEPLLHLYVNPPEQATFIDWPTISPDGRTLVLLAEVNGKRQLWVHPLSGATARPLVEVQDPLSLPFWSPDSQFIAYFELRKLKKIALAGGAPEILCDATSQTGGTWNREGVILFGGGWGTGIKRVSANGGDVTTVTSVDTARGDRDHQSPAFLPDGRHFLYYIGNPDPAKNGIYLASLEGSISRLVMAANAWNAEVVQNPADQRQGYLLFVRQGALLAQPFDFSQGQVTGHPVRIAERVVAKAAWRARFSVATNGTVVVQEKEEDQQLIWFDRAGKKLGTVGPPGIYTSPKLSPDGQRLAVEQQHPQTQLGDIHLFGLAGGEGTRFTFGPSRDGFPLWSPDGSQMVWASGREGVHHLFQKAANGAGQDEVLWRSAYQKYSQDWSADGRFILYAEQNPQTSRDLWVLPWEGERKPWPWLNTPASESAASFSPDGKWIAYTSNESGRSEIYVQAFVPGAPAAGGKRQLSTSGGSAPQWRRDGRELYYLTADGKLMAVDITPGAELKAGLPKELFAPSGYQIVGALGYTMTSDGQRFLFVTRAENGSVPPFMVVLNWMAGLKK